jgi:hypothetical protein
VAWLGCGVDVVASYAFRRHYSKKQKAGPNIPILASLVSTNVQNLQMLWSVNCLDYSVMGGPVLGIGHRSIPCGGLLFCSCAELPKKTEEKVLSQLKNPISFVVNMAPSDQPVEQSVVGHLWQIPCWMQKWMWWSCKSLS